jgi:NAD(P)-dependent dehydrogenase (short-subunit alcohol dehydrogenase family)
MVVRDEKRGAAAPGRVRVAGRVAMGAAMLVAALGGAANGLSAQQVPASEIEGREVIMITGSTDGLGRSVALALAGSDAHIIVHGRNAQRGAEVVEEIRAAGGTARFYQADLASLAQVRELAAAIQRDYPRLDVLINNAGIGRGQPEAPREVSADGYELRMAVNYLSHFYLTRTLIPLLQRSAPSRVVSVSSSAQATGEIDFSNIMLEREPYEGAFAYGQSKLMQIFMTFDLEEEFGATGVTFNAVHPGHQHGARAWRFGDDEPGRRGRVRRQRGPVLGVRPVLQRRDRGPRSRAGVRPRRPSPAPRAEFRTRGDGVAEGRVNGL